MKKFTSSNDISGWSVKTDTGWSPINALHTTVEYEIWEIETADGLNIKCADNHILFDEDFNEVFVKDLSVGNNIQTNTGIQEITSIFKTGDYEEMYDFELSDMNHRYYTNGILSHNTHLAKNVADYMFGGEESMIRVDMSEYMEPHSVSKLIGSPPGYVGHDDGGQLTERVRRKPHSLILFDEIEKAHPLVFNVMLQMLDDGHLTDGMGRKVDFRNCLIIMTSNTGTRELEEFGTGIGFKARTVADTAQMEKDALVKAMKKRFAPEFLNRIDEIVIFNKLADSDVASILELELEGLKANLLEVGGYKLRISKAAKQVIMDQGYDEKYGARQLARTIESLIENRISEMVLKGEVTEDDTISVKAKGGKISLSKG